MCAIYHKVVQNVAKPVQKQTETVQSQSNISAVVLLWAKVCARARRRAKKLASARRSQRIATLKLSLGFPPGPPFGRYNEHKKKRPPILLGQRTVSAKKKGQQKKIGKKEA
jgi:hypothetical protein